MREIERLVIPGAGCRGNGDWLFSGYYLSFWSNENILLSMVIVAQNCGYAKITELNWLNWWILYCMNFISWKMKENPTPYTQTSEKEGYSSHMQHTQKKKMYPCKHVYIQRDMHRE